MADTDYAWMLEQLDTESPGDLSLAPGSTEATLFFIVNTNDIYKTFLYILGYTEVSTENNIALEPTLGFNRQLPMSHPRYPYLYADTIDIVGIGTEGQFYAGDVTYPQFIYRNPAAAGQVDYKTFRFYEYNKQLRIAVRYTSRNYFLLTNDQIKQAINSEAHGGNKKFQYYKKNPSNPNGWALGEYYDLREMLRYTEVIGYQPNVELIANSTGKAYWKSKGQNGEVPANGPSFDSPVTLENTSTNFQTIAKNDFKIKWYQIPKYLFLPSGNQNYRPWDYGSGMCNFGGNFDTDPGNIQQWNVPFFNFQSGTLLYQGYELEEGGSSFPFIPYDTTATTLPYNSFTNQYYNVIFNFSYFAVPPKQLHPPRLQNVTCQLGSMYTNGWNFVPVPSRNFYYIESGDLSPGEKFYPPYYSFPFQLLFNPRAEITPV